MADKDPTFAPPLSALLTGSPVLAAGTSTIQPASIAGYPSDPNRIFYGDGAWLNPPGFQYAYAEFTSSVSVTSTNEAVPTDVVSTPSLSYLPIPIVIEFYAEGIGTAAGVAAFVICNLWDGNTDLGRMTAVQTPAAATMIVSASASKRLTPTLGTHTYKIRAWESGGTGTIYAGTGGIGTIPPGFIRITKA